MKMPSFFKTIFCCFYKVSFFRLYDLLDLCLTVNLIYTQSEKVPNAELYEKVSNDESDDESFHPGADDQPEVEITINNFNKRQVFAII